MNEHVENIYTFPRMGILLDKINYANNTKMCSRISLWERYKFFLPIAILLNLIFAFIGRFTSLLTNHLFWRRRKVLKVFPEWRYPNITTGILLLPLVITTTEAFCPHGCSCNDISVDCNKAGLETVPILLNPRTVSISLSGNAISSLQQDLIFYTDLTTLDLSSNRISLLEDKSFEGQKVLKALTLNNNSITMLLEDNFYGLGNLEFLSLNDNSISRISDRVFKGLDMLESLSLRNNKIKDIDMLGFEYLRSIRSINLSQNRLDRLPIASIANLMSLEEMNFSDNYISRVPENAFQKLTQLQHLDLSRNNISSIRSDSFSGLLKLKSLKLVDNRLASIPLSAFPPLKSLSSLDLSGNLFTSVPRDFLGGLPSLASLRVERCPRLLLISQDSFVSGWRLQELSLRQNPHLTALPPAALAPLLALKTLDISSCGLQTLQPTQVSYNGLI